MPSAIAIFAHPADIEFLASGTLVLLRQGGWEIHCMALSSGDCGSRIFAPQQTSEIRVKEALTAAQLLGASFHGSPAKDHQILYEVEAVRRLAATIRKVKPSVILTHSPENCIEDHSSTSRIVVSAAYVRALPNFGTHPPSESVEFETTIYHAMPFGLRDGMRRRIYPELYIDTGSVHQTKQIALAAHASQRDGMEHISGAPGGCAAKLDEMSRELGGMSGAFEHAEGWRRHSHLGFSRQEIDPLAQALSRHCLLNPAYEEALEQGSYPSS